MRKLQGQSAIYIILIVVAAAAIILSFIIRTLLNFRSAAVSERSARVFSASEAGIEEALRRGLAVADFSVEVGGIKVDVTSQTLMASNFFIFPRSIKKDETVTIWLVGHIDPSTADLDNSLGQAYSANNISVCWGTPGSADIAAIIVSLIYKNGSGNYQVAKWALDPDGGRGNNFDSNVLSGVSLPSACQNETTYAKNLDFSGITYTILELLRIKPLYADAKIGTAAASGAQIPAQGVERISTAQLGDVTRRSKVFQSYPSLPAIFDYAIFTTGSLTK